MTSYRMFDICSSNLYSALHSYSIVSLFVLHTITVLNPQQSESDFESKGSRKKRESNQRDEFTWFDVWVSEKNDDKQALCVFFFFA